jgi:hypothetical protein
MAPEQGTEQQSAYGEAPRQWEQALIDALDLRDHARLKQTLASLRTELGSQVRLLDRMDRAPVLDHLVEHARRLLRSAPTQQEALERELAQERRLWAAFRERYREHFVPAALRPFLASSSLFVCPSTTGVQYDGFEKYTGHSNGFLREAMTLFHKIPTGETVGEKLATPPNIVTCFDEHNSRFVVYRVYKTDLPRNAGKDCILEQIALLIPDLSSLRELVFDNVQNSKTYETHVIREGNGIRRLRENVDIDQTPLGRFALRILSDLELKAASIRPVLDSFGFLDLHLKVEPA